MSRRPVELFLCKTTLLVFCPSFTPQDQWLKSLWEKPELDSQDHQLQETGKQDGVSREHTTAAGSFLEGPLLWLLLCTCLCLCCLWLGSKLLKDGERPYSSCPTVRDEHDEPGTSGPRGLSMLQQGRGRTGKDSSPTNCDRRVTWHRT